MKIQEIKTKESIKFLNQLFINSKSSLKVVVSLLIMVIIFAACNKEEQALNVIENWSSDALIWEKKINNEVDSRSIITPLYYNNGIVNFHNGDTTSSIDYRNALTGDLIWTYNLESNYTFSSLKNGYSSDNNILVIQSSESVLVMDLNNGTVLKELADINAINPVKHEQSILIHGSKLYFYNRDYSLQNQDFYIRLQLLEVDFVTDEKRVIHETKLWFNDKARTKGLISYINDKNEMLLILPSYQYCLQEDQTLTVCNDRLIAYNLELDKIVWDIRGLQSQGTEINSPTVVVSGKIVYYCIADDCYALDVDSGEQIWSKEFKTTISNNILVDETRLIIKESLRGEIIALDKLTGQTIWTYKSNISAETSALTYSLALDSDYVYALGEKLQMIEIKSGNLKYCLPSPRSTNSTKASFGPRSPGFSDDEQFLFLTDGNFDYCFKHPDQ